jgi:voltage-gated potassium channel
MRFLRLFRLTAYTKSYQLILNVFKSRFNELLLSFILTFFLIIISACLVYFAEHGTNPQFTSIPTTLYWAVVTLTTVGYGDITPITFFGRVFTSTILLIGVAMLALPAGIITSGFLDELRKVKKSKTFNCPHCGKPIDQIQNHEDHNGH